MRAPETDTQPRRRSRNTSPAPGDVGPREPAPRHCMVVHARYPLTETRVQREAEALVAAGFEVDVICLREPGELPHERSRGVEIHRLPVRLDKRSLLRQLRSYVRFMILASVRLSKLHLRRRYGTVQVHNLPDFLVYSALVPKAQGVPVILDLHDLMPEFFAGRFGPHGRRSVARLIRWQERLACRFADHVITVSEHWRQELIRRGVPKDKCSVVMNVADERVFARPRSPRSADGEFRLIYHGTVTQRYGLDLAIRAVALVKEEIPEVRLTILGQGDQMPELARLRGQLGLEEIVELHDEFRSAEDLPQFIEGADLGIVPYRNDLFTDGLLPTKLMEYAVMGIPCIAARTTAIDAYFRDTMVEFFVPGDAADLARCIRELHMDPIRLAHLSRKSRDFTLRHNWTDIGAGYVATIRRLSAPARYGEPITR
jgi:glycosyltransferase involved in cell wall biosynthesis